MSNGASHVVLGRRCETCTLCCKILSVEALQKPQGQWCKHCDVGVGCRIYDERPSQCRDFYCGFLTLQELSETWRPSKSKIVLVAELDGNRIAAYVDPGRVDAWRAEPFYSKLKEWAIAWAPGRKQVVVLLGRRAIVILPDRDVDLGSVADDELIVTQERSTQFGVTWDALKIKKDGPRAATSESRGHAQVKGQ